MVPFCCREENPMTNAKNPAVSTLEGVLNELELSFKETEKWLKEDRQLEAELKRRPLTTKEILTAAQRITDTHYFPALDPVDPVTTTELVDLLAEHKASVDTLSAPFAPYHVHPSNDQSQPVDWLWDKRIPAVGITPLDGNHGCGKSLLSLHIAAAVSRGSPLPDGSPTVAGGVVIISPHTDARTSQLQILKDLGADLANIKILSFVKEDAPAFHTSGHRPFSLPEDLISLFLAIKSVNARLVIIDPFISVLGRFKRCTNESLYHLLIDLNERFIERNIACLLIRNCPAKGGHARPSVLERSGHFDAVAASHLLLSPDPFQPDRILLAHTECTDAPLASTLTLQIRPSPTNPDLPRITVFGSHRVSGKDLIANRPDTLHRRLLSEHLYATIAQAPGPVPVATLRAHAPTSSPFQIQRSLKDLINMGQIEHPAHGFYTLAPANPTFPQGSTATKPANTKLEGTLNGVAAKPSNTRSEITLNDFAGIP